MLGFWLIYSCNQEIKELIDSNVESPLNLPITTDEIYEASKFLKNNKSVGLDQISNEMIKCALPFMHTALKRLFNSILWNTHYPKEWKVGIIVNLFKSGDAYDPNNTTIQGYCFTLWDSQE